MAAVASLSLLGCEEPSGAFVKVYLPPSDAAVDAAPTAADAAPEAPDERLLEFLTLPPAVATPSALVPYVRPNEAPFAPRTAPRHVPPLSGGTLAASKDWIVASDPDRDQLYVIDAKLMAVRRVALSEGEEPGRVALESARAFVVLRRAGVLLTLDLASASVLHATQVCAAPRGVFVDGAASRVLVTCADGNLVSVATDGSRVLSKQHIAPDLRDVGRDAQGIWVSQYRAAALLRLDAALQPTARQLPAEVEVRAGTGQPRKFTPSLAWRTLPGADGTPIMLHQRAQSSVIPRPNPSTPSVSPYGGPSAAPGVRNDAFGFCESGVVHTTLSSFAADGPSPGPALPQAVVPLDLAVAPGGAEVAVIAPGNLLQDSAFEQGSVGPRQLFVLPASDLAPRAIAPTQLSELQGDCASASAQVEHRFPGEAIALQYADEHTLFVQVRSPAELHVLRRDERKRFRLRAVVTLAPDTLRDTGHEVFHQNTSTGIACASCHGEALDDGHAWNFEVGGLRRTQSLRGRVLARSPFHWSGDLGTLDALVSDVYEQRMGGTKLMPEARAALGRWLNELPLVPAEPGEAATLARGRDVFESSEAACASCHEGVQLGGTELKDVGTGGAFKIPSLRGVALRLPLMHNGCAETLEERFDPACGGSAHGKTSHLSTVQMADLLAYLRSL